MPQEYIEIRGARENNLKNVSLRIPKRKITIFTGVSGSGKSSIVFDTIATEAQRLLYETFSMFVRNFLPRYAQPDADSIENLEHGHRGGPEAPGRRLTFHRGHDHRYLHGAAPVVLAGWQAFRRLFQRLFFQRSTGHVPGMQRARPQAATASLKNSTILPSRCAKGAIQGPVFDDSIYMASGFFDNDKKLSEFTKKEMDLLLYAPRSKNSSWTK